MRSFSKLVGTVMAAVLLAGCGGAAVTVSSPSSPSAATAPAAPKVGAPLPDFNLTGLDGQIVHSADLAGKPAVVNFWASWCSACVQELPTFQSAAQQLPPDQVKFLFVNVQDTPDSVKSYLSQLGFNQPVALDSQGDVAMKLKVVGLPTTFFVDSSGALRYIVNGEISQEQLRYNLQALVPGIAMASPEASAPAQASEAAAPTPQPSAATVPSALPADAPKASNPAASPAAPASSPGTVAAPSQPARAPSAQPASAHPASSPAAPNAAAPTSKNTTSSSQPQQQPANALPCDC
jgi:cytochrome c biogenesis protein CcmG/thiol:disulfide interchange protein DsbE